MMDARPPVQRRAQKRTVQAAGLPVSADTVLTTATLAVIPVYVLMLAQPRLAKRLLNSPAVFATGAAAHTALLLSWLQSGALAVVLAALRSCSPLPSMGRVTAAFLQAEVTALAWFHLLLLDLFQARSVFLSGLSESVPTGKKQDASGPALADLHDDVPDVEHPRRALASLPVKHVNDKAALMAEYEQCFPKWRFQLREGFSLLLYGFGSKRVLLERFAVDELLDGGVLAVNGLVPGLSARGLLLRVASAMRLPRSGSSHAILQSIRDLPAEPPMYVVIHNVEGSGLRPPDAQAMLSELAACACIGLVASMDNVNTPLLWDKQVAARFNWLYHDATTYAPYMTESMHVPSLLLGRKEVRQAAGAATVLRTLVPNARAIFRLLAEFQMADDEDGGIAFPHLFRLCRERFLVGNELGLRAHLTEFRDHELLQTRRAPDGTDLLSVPMEDDALRRLLQDMDASGEVS
ncbi:hypothetical protein WJX81_003690 [Elliptochloris bilobata]|uniref:Origin recognition complex subunit 2 n=1 Tax=Elliptochloris bilobata TaxID=381761 RepID=A0AAW1SHG0_9CHLO